jgi:ABC-2 type transport system ATP-binding protein
MEKVIEVSGLRKAYGTTVAADGISFDVPRGEIFALVGPNGAGKTTTIECVEGYRAPDAGTVRVLGVDPRAAGVSFRERIGVQLQEANLPARIKVWEAADLFASFYARALDWRPLVEELGLAEKMDVVFSKLSGGQRQRLFIVLALLNDPEVLFLDEITTGLDPQARHKIWDFIRKVREQGRTVFLTTHFMEEAERLADRVAILDHGRLVALDTPANLVRNVGADMRVVFDVDGPLDTTLLSSLQPVTRVEHTNGQVTVFGRDGALAAVVQGLEAQGVKYHGLRTQEANLEDVYLALTGGERRE